MAHIHWQGYEVAVEPDQNLGNVNTDLAVKTLNANEMEKLGGVFLREIAKEIRECPPENVAEISLDNDRGDEMNECDANQT